MAAGRIESRSMQYWGTRRSPNGTASHADEIFVLPFYLGTRAMEEYWEDFAFEESIENEAVCQIRKQIYEKRTVKVIQALKPASIRFLHKTCSQGSEDRGKQAPL
ncbi:hypothetical protein Bbelb_056030 [Branchiostoma belcheri]|nr:hypothetical protein Bbelb_056030 [Branchiostoma belcheri]